MTPDAPKTSSATALSATADSAGASETIGAGACSPPSVLRRDCRTPSASLELARAVCVGRGDAVRQHLLAGGACDCFAGRGDEGVALLAGREEEQSGVRAELAGAEGQRADVRLGEGCRVGVREGAGEDDDRVDRGHLGVHRDRLGALGRRRDEREPAGAGAGEADGLDARVLDERLAELEAARPGGR